MVRNTTTNIIGSLTRIQIGDQIVDLIAVCEQLKFIRARAQVVTKIFVSVDLTSLVVEVLNWLCMGCSCASEHDLRLVIFELDVDTRR